MADQHIRPDHHDTHDGVSSSIRAAAGRETPGKHPMITDPHYREHLHHQTQLYPVTDSRYPKDK